MCGPAGKKRSAGQSHRVAAIVVLVANVQQLAHAELVPLQQMELCVNRMRTMSQEDGFAALCTSLQNMYQQQQHLLREQQVFNQQRQEAYEQQQQAERHEQQVSGELQHVMKEDSDLREQVKTLRAQVAQPRSSKKKERNSVPGRAEEDKKNIADQYTPRVVKQQTQAFELAEKFKETQEQRMRQQKELGHLRIELENLKLEVATANEQGAVLRREIERLATQKEHDRIRLQAEINSLRAQLRLQDGFANSSRDHKSLLQKARDGSMLEQIRALQSENARLVQQCA